MAKQTKTAAKQQTKAAARIVGDVVRMSDGVRVFFVTSQSQPGKLYRVQVLRGRLDCRCSASVFTGSCTHRKLVHAVLEAEYAERKATRDVVTISISAPVTTKPATRPAKPAPQSQLNRTRGFSMLA